MNGEINMTKINIPTDIEKKLKKNIKTDLIKFFILLILFISLAVSLEILILSKARLSIRMLGYVILIFIFSLIMHKQFHFQDHSFIGVIEKIEVKETLGSIIKGSQVHYYVRSFNNHVVLNIKTEDEQTIIKETFHGNAKFREFVDYYKQGDRVVYLKGSKYVYRVPSNPNDTILCVVCGGLNLQTNSKCVFCSHTLLNIDKIQ